MRLAKYIAHAGVASRRKAEELISQGKVRVNGRPVDTPAFEVDPAIDRVEINGALIAPEAKQYIIMNKPSGYLSTVTDPFGRPTVIDLIGDMGQRLYPVGRLDLDTEGLLLLSNDGDFTNQMIHPRHKVPKRYEARVMGRVRPEKLEQLARGVELDDGWTAPARVKLIKYEHKETLVEIEIYEGRKRQVKRMFEAVGHPVVHLVRTGFGHLTLENLAVGEYRYLTPEEVDRLLALATGRSKTSDGGGKS